MDPFEESAREIELNMGPVSLPVYRKAYNVFLEWFKITDIAKGESPITEKVLLVYFYYRVNNKNASLGTIWPLYSMLTFMLRRDRGIDVKQFVLLQAYCREVTKNYKPKKATVFTQEELYKFFSTAKDDKYLLHKVNTSIPVIYKMVILIINS